MPGPDGELSTANYRIPEFVRQGLKVAYCAQNPFVMHASVRDNIVFGEEFEEARWSFPWLWAPWWRAP